MDQALPASLELTHVENPRSHHHNVNLCGRRARAALGQPAGSPPRKSPTAGAHARRTRAWRFARSLHSLLRARALRHTDGSDSRARAPTPLPSRRRCVALLALVGSASAFIAAPAQRLAARSVSVSAEPRREFLAGLGAAAGLAVAAPAGAIVDYAGLPYIGGSEKIDINNANVRVYIKLPGMYPGAAGKVRARRRALPCAPVRLHASAPTQTGLPARLRAVHDTHTETRPSALRLCAVSARQICTNGPYKSVSDLYNIKGMSEKEKNVIKKYESRLLVGPPEPAYVIDRINNGLYR